MGIIVAMLLWVSPGSAAAINGFSDVARCEDSIPSVRYFYARLGQSIEVSCVILPPP